MSAKPDILFFARLLLIHFLCAVSPSHAQSIEDLKKGVVKITAQADGKTKVGSGFIVRLEKDAAYIVTASHVIEGDPQPKVVFRGKESKSFPAQVKGMKGGDARGVAVLAVLGDLPQGVESLHTSSDFEINGGEAVTVIGFPRVPAVPWAVTPGVVTGQEGEYLVFSGAAAEGNSGGPVLWNGKVVGVVTEVLSQYGYAVPIPILRLALRGWGVSLEGAPKDGVPMVMIPAGEFIMGSQEGDKKADSTERPAHRVYLEAFYIDQYEVTTSRYAKFFQETNRFPPLHWSDQVLKKHGDKPVIGVAWNEAAAYCTWSRKRLPTEAEWEKAARGPDQRLFPWGNEAPTSQRANFDYSRFTDYGMLTNVGSFERGKSPYDAYDMAGNAGEWVADWYDAGYYGKSPARNPQGPSNGEIRVLRGGSYSHGSDGLRSTLRNGLPPTDRFEHVGFRCAQDVQK